MIYNAFPKYLKDELHKVLNNSQDINMPIHEL